MRLFRRRSRTLKARASVAGRYKVEVVDAASGDVVQSRPWAKNLILDQGMNALFTTYAAANAFLRCAVGTGTTPTYRDSAAVTIAVASGVATASASFFDAADASNNRVLKLDSGEEYRITGFTSDTQVNVTGVDAAASAGTVWFTEQTGLSSEQKRTATYLTGTGNCGTSYISNTVVMLRTYDFTAEASNQNYTELGWANSASVGNNLFSRTLIAGGTVTVLTGQALRVRYELTFSFGPTTAQPASLAVTGWPVAPATTIDGDYIGVFNSTWQPFEWVTTGGNAAIGQPRTWDAIGTKGIMLSTDTALPSFSGTPGMTNQVGANASAQSYIAGSFKREWRASFDQNSANRTDWRLVSIIANNTETSVACASFLFDEAQTKDNLHTLRIDFELAYARVLTNP